MPRPKSPPRLWLDKNRQAWTVIDGTKRIRSGCGKGELQKAKDFLRDYLADHHTVVPNADPLIADILAYYSTEHLAGKPSAASVAQDMVKLEDWWGLKTASEITSENCKLYIAHRNAPTICRREIGFLHAATMFWHKSKKGPLRALPIVHKPPRTENRTRWLTRSEAARFLWMTRKLGPRRRKRLRRFFIVGWYTGTRHRAITRISYGMIDFEARIMHRRPPGAPETRKRTPPVRIGARLLSHLKRWRRLDGPEARYLIAHGGKPVNEIGDGWRECRILAGLGPDVIPHTLRHSRATHLMRQGVDPWQAARSLGMSLEMLQNTYGHHHPDWQVDAADAR